MNFFRFFVAIAFVCVLPGCSEGISTHQESDHLRVSVDSLNDVVVEAFERGYLDIGDSLLDTVFFHPQFQSRYALKKYYARLGSRRFGQGRYREALEISNRYLSIIDTTNVDERHEYARELTSHGSIYFELGNYPLAYRYYYDARRMYADDTCFVGYSDYSIAMVLYRQGKFHEAARAFESAYSGYRVCSYTFERDLRLQEIVSNIGLCYYHLGKYDSALMAYDRALKLVEEFNQEEQSRIKWKDIAKGIINGNKSRVFHKLSNFDSAYSTAIRAASVNLQPSYDQRDGLIILLHLASMHWETGRYDALDTALSLADQYIDSLEDNRIQLQWLDLKRKQALQFERWDEASLYASSYISLSDSLHEAQREMSESDINLALQTLDSEYRFGLLRQENYYVEKSVVYLLVILALTVSGAVVVVFFLRSAKKRNSLLAGKSKDLEGLNRQLQRMNAEKDRILEIAAHDLRTPVGAILSLAEFLKKDNVAEDERNEMIELVETAGQSSMELINEILLIADLKERSYVRHPIEVNEFLKKTVDLIKFKADDKRQRIYLELLPSRQTIYGDPERLRRALSNLISNAIKFSKETSSITVKAELGSHAICLSVSDEGIGIPESMGAELFSAFTKSKRPGTNGEKPFGLGLSIVKEIVKGHKGKLWFDSKEGEGSVFYIELPIVGV